MMRCRRNNEVGNELTLKVCFNMLFVTVMRLSTFFRPRCIYIFLSRFIFIPFWSFTRFYLFVFIRRVSLNRYFSKTCINHNSFFCYKSMSFQLFAKLGKKLINYTGLGQIVTKQPNRFRIRNNIVKTLTNKFLEGQSVQQLKFNLIITQSIILLQYENLKHQ